MTADQYKKCARANNIFFHDDAQSAIQFVMDLIDEEISILRETEPFAANPIKRLEDARYQLHNLKGDTEDYVV